MKNASFASRKPLGSDNIRRISAALPRDSKALRSTAKKTRFVKENGGNKSEDLRSIVGGRIMRMLQAHDRARMELLATHFTETK